MQEFEIQPKLGVGPIQLGMSRADVRQHLGMPEGGEDDEREWYLEDLAVDFDRSGKVTFIEISESEHYQTTYQGKNLLALDADDAVAHVAAVAPYDENAPEFGYTYIFPDLQLSLWRAMIPDEEQDPDDPTGRRFASIGVGGDGYFDD